MKKIFTLLLALTMLFTLAACAADAPADDIDTDIADEDIIGDDWHTYGLYSFEYIDDISVAIDQVNDDTPEHVGFDVYIDGDELGELLCEIRCWDGEFLPEDMDKNDYLVFEDYNDDGLTDIGAPLKSGDIMWYAQGAGDSGEIIFTYDGTVLSGYELSDPTLADTWYLFGDLANESITIYDDGSWEMRNHLDTDGSGGYITCEGSGELDDAGTLFLYEDGSEVACVFIEEGELIMYLTDDYEWLLESYLPGELIFTRENDCETIQSDPGDGGISGIYVDSWCLFGDRAFESLTVYSDSTWEFRNRLNADGSGGYIFCEGYSALDEEDLLFLYEKSGDEVGFAKIEDDILTLTLTEDYEWTFEEYSSGLITFNRESDSIDFEPQPTSDTKTGSSPEDYEGYWLYDDGFILEVSGDEWTLYTADGELAMYGEVTYTDIGAELIANDDNNAEYGLLYYDENGNTFESAVPITLLDHVPSVLD